MSERVDFLALRSRAGNLRAEDLVKAAENLGWTLARVKGSHHLMTKPGVPTLVISQHANRRTYLSVIKVLERENDDGDSNG